MLSKNKIKYIRSLELKKNRKEAQAFLAEGHKLVGDLLSHFRCLLIVATSRWLQNHAEIQAEEIIEVTEEELARASLLKAPQEVLGVFKQPQYLFNPNIAKEQLCLALDDVQDPGNLGTIVRIADWFGIKHIFCSTGTADIYNPKTVQATMGAIARVKLHYCNLSEVLGSLTDIPVFGTFLDGENIYTQELSNHGIIVMGNEGKGISRVVKEACDFLVTIPMYGNLNSLNASVAAAVLMYEAVRQRQAK